MAPPSEPSQNPFDILQDEATTPSGSDQQSGVPPPDKANCAALKELDVDRSQNALSAPPQYYHLESLTVELEKFHIRTPPSKGDGLNGILRRRTIGGYEVPGNRSSTPSRTPQASPSKAKHIHFALPAPAPASVEAELQSESKSGSHSIQVFSPDRGSSSVPRTRVLHLDDSFSRQQLAKHRASQFEWVLAVPFPSNHPADARRRRSNSGSNPGTPTRATSIRKVYFGCNLLHRRTQSGSDDNRGPANAYTLIATPIGGDEESATVEAVPDETETMAETKLGGQQHAGAGDVSELQPNFLTEGVGASPNTLASSRASSFVSHPSPRSPGASVARIEDTFEELDRLEDQFEAVGHLVRVKRVPSPDKLGPAAAHEAGASASSPSVKRTASSAKKPIGKSNSVRIKSTPGAALGRAGSLRKTASATFSKDGQETAAGKTLARKGSVIRPASLMPPKPAVRSSKPPTVPTFELPGEAVARRLKEQREARMSQHGTAQPASPAPVVPQRTRSTKAPTRPTFELPGEAISRRKREEREAKLKAQEEEERKRREFKARPVRTSMAPASYPKETITSRVRQSKTASTTATASDHGEDTASTTSSSKPSSSAGPPQRSTSLCVSSSTQPRGRGTSVAESPSGAQPSRAASSSTGSASGKRSLVSAEEVQHQKLRGKEIYIRDNSVTAERERERREREAAAKTARQEAAERSRMLSREWAEKQKQRVKKLVSAARA